MQIHHDVFAMDVDDKVQYYAFLVEWKLSLSPAHAALVLFQQLASIRPTNRWGCTLLTQEKSMKATFFVLGDRALDCKSL